MVLEGKNTKLLCDPWVTFDRKSSSGLFNFPELKLSREEVKHIHPDFIYISHTHEDHFDPDTLDLFDKETPILVSFYKNNFTAKRVSDLGFSNVLISDPENGIALNGGDHCWIEPNGVYSDVDSLGVFKIDEKSVLNANDNPFSEYQCKTLFEKFGSVDLACLPYGFQGPYPAFYENLNSQEKKVEADHKTENNYEVVKNYINTLRPKKVFLFAAGAVYGGAKALQHNFYGVGTPQGAIDFLKSEGIELDPILLSQKMSYDIKTDIVEGDYKQLSFEDEHEYVEAISLDKGPFSKGGSFYISDDEQVDLTRLLKMARQRQNEWQQRKNIESDSVFFIDVGQSDLYRLTLGDDTVTRVPEHMIEDNAYEIFRMPYSLLVALLTRHYNFSNVKTQHMTFFRKPNIFNPDLHILMSFLQI